LLVVCYWRMSIPHWMSQSHHHNPQHPSMFEGKKIVNFASPTNLCTSSKTLRSKSQVMLSLHVATLTWTWQPKMKINWPTFPQTLWCTLKFLDGLNWESKGEDSGRRRSWSALPGSQHFRGKGAC
jgi:hypothetical protein